MGGLTAGDYLLRGLYFHGYLSQSNVFDLDINYRLRGDCDFDRLT